MPEPSAFSINEDESLDQLSDNSSIEEAIETVEKDTDDNNKEII